MERTDETPRRRRTKRRNETRERDSTRSETDRSAARRRRIRRGDDKRRAKNRAVEDSDESDDEGIVNNAAVEDSDGESDDEDEAISTPGSSSTIASSTAPPPGTTTLSPPPPPPPVATPPSATLDSQTLPPASTTLGTQTFSQSATNTPVAAAETTDPPRAQNGAGPSRQSTAAPPAATIVIAVFGSLAGVSLLAFLFWKLYRGRRGRDEPDQSSGKEIFVGGPKSDIRIMDEAMAAAYKAEGGNTSTIGFIPPREDPSRDGTADQGVSRWNDSTPGWLRRQVQKVKSRTSPDAAAGAAAAQDDSSPKDAAVSRWMDRHASRMLDPMAARASVASSGAASLRGLGPVPSVSPASVVGGQRESILSEMGQIRRAAVPPPLDLKMVERVKQMQEEDQVRKQERTRGPAGGDVQGGVLRPPPPMADRWGNSSPTAMSQARTETTWNTWGVEQRRK
ncbi:hypothetical protein INS49_013398 [Diaporthe citri]|uniref:uncharacterized protein n=1 Tax=Diaporthe citri TaxID=83186 RepID=UPI001C8208D3|nr:uncharacterized protein INS49_013398 [Diaporthe citri]KAG6357521.1 hypothetical protein INS49_013398 [Diaporthe citri]